MFVEIRDGKVAAIATVEARGCDTEVGNGDELLGWWEEGYRAITVEDGIAVRDESEVVEREPTLEEQVKALASQIAAITEYQGVTVRQVGEGVYEVVKRTTGAGTESEPYEYAEGVELVPNAFYTHDGKLYVYMSNSKSNATGDFESDGTWTEW